MVPKNLAPQDKWSPQPVPLDKWNILQTICSGGPNYFVHGDRNFGDHLSMGTELVGDRLSRGTNQLGTNCGEPNIQGPYAFGTKCVKAGD